VKCLNSDSRQIFRLEQTRETIQTVVALIAKGRAEPARQFFAGALPLIDRDIRA
jgi:hypothetical protein